MNIKNSVTAVIAGFVLSFLVGVICKVPLAVVLLRAIICAVACGGIAFGIQYAFGRFLGVPSAEGGASDVPPPPGVHARQKTGGIVDITLADESLEDDGAGPVFTVRKDLQPFAAAAQPSAPAAPKQAAAQPAEAPAFRPVQLGVAAAPVQPAAGSAPAQGGISVQPGDSDAVLDDLPDIKDIVPELSAGDSDAAPAGFPDVAPAPGAAPSAPAWNSGKSAAPPSMDNISDMAAAIRTVLAKDGS